MSAHPQPAAAASPWSPFRHRAFRALWIATLVSNIGTWMHEVGAGWLMVTLAPDPLWVSLVSAATTLPIFFLALPAGALADIVDRRHYLIVTQGWMLAAALLLAVLTLMGRVDAPLLLWLTAALGAGAAMTTPAYAATVPELVPRSDLPAAIALNSMGVNVARAIGPAFAGVIVAALGPAATFMLNAVSFVGVIVVLARWRREVPTRNLPGERFFGALRAGLRYTRGAPALQRVLVRSLVFFFPATALWSLLPLVMRDGLGGDASVYGALLAAIGLGAVSGAFVMPKIRSRFRRDAIVLAASLLYAAAMAGITFMRAWPLAAAVLLGTGAAWLGVLSSLHVSAQSAVPAWVRARALSVYLVVFAAGMAGGAWFWGKVAAMYGVPSALVAAAIVVAVAGIAAMRASLGDETVAYAATAAAWPTPQADVEPDRGPVLITVEYRVAPEDLPAFRVAARELERIRRRDGAIGWNLFVDAEAPDRVVETFVVESWAEHLRQHDRVTVGDRDVIEAARRYHRGEAAPLVRHFIAPEAPPGGG